MEEKDEIKDPFEECKKVLEDFLTNADCLHICSKSFREDIDSYVRDYLVEKGYGRFLAHDVSYGPQVGKISEGVLCSFVRSGKIFDNKKGKFYLKETYGVHSVRLFQAWPA